MISNIKKYGTERIIGVLTLIVIGCSLLVASWYMLHGTLDFHTDIARDFLLFEDIYYNKNITLLGPRSGGISGVFHGPLWLYLNLPAYIIGQGNPVAVGWFWVLLFGIGIGIVYKIGSLLFGKKVGMIAASIFALSTAAAVPAAFNPFGAVIIAPLFFYYASRYVQKPNYLDLLIAFFTIGVVIQFQMAFGAPILVLFTPLVVFLIFKKKRWLDLTAFCVLVIPLSSFIVFELRHDFLQVRSVMHYLDGSTKNVHETRPFWQLLWNRFDLMTRGALGYMTAYKHILSYLAIGAFWIGFRKATPEDKGRYRLFLYFYIGYWIVTLPFNGTIWGYYFWPFLPLFAIIFASLLKYLPTNVFFLLLATILLMHSYYAVRLLMRPFSPEDTSNWAFYRIVGEDLFHNAPAEFGYYIYTTDQFGYSTRYAINYMQRKFPQKRGVPYEKKHETYLLIDDPGDNVLTNSVDWKKNDIKISTAPSRIKRYSKTFWVEKYDLTDSDIKEVSNPNLIQNLIFR